MHREGENEEQENEEQENEELRMKNEELSQYIGYAQL